MAPEILSGQGHYSMSADVYSYGILMISLWNQKPPYSEVSVSSPSELFKRIFEEGLRPSIGSDCPQSYLNLSQACIVSDPHSRPSFSEICSKVFNSWFLSFFTHAKKNHSFLLTHTFFSTFCGFNTSFTLYPIAMTKCEELENLKANHMWIELRTFWRSKTFPHFLTITRRYAVC